MKHLTSLRLLAGLAAVIACAAAGQETFDAKAYFESDAFRAELAWREAHLANHRVVPVERRAEIQELIERARVASKDGRYADTFAAVAEAEGLIRQSEQIDYKRTPGMMPGGGSFIEAVERAEAYDPEQRVLVKRWDNIPSIRFTVDYAIALFESGGPEHVARANDIVEMVASNQVRNPDDFALGGYYVDEIIDRAPSIDHFIPPRLIRIGNEYEHLLRPEVKGKLWESLPFVIDGIMKYWYPVRMQRQHIGHTNYYFLYIAALSGLGELAGDDRGQRAALGCVQDWMGYTLENGIPEFNSPTYAGTNLDALETAWRYTQNARLRGAIEQCMDYIYLDLAYHYFPPSQWITGANSRCYGAAAGMGGGSQRMQRLVAGRLRANEATYAPPEYIRQIAAKKHPIVFRGRYLDEPHADRTTYVTPDFALGTVGQYSGSQDRPLVADIASQKTLGSIAAVLDTFGTPFDLPSAGSYSGQAHDPMHAATVQHEGEAVVVLDVRPNALKGGRKVIRPTIIFPANVDRILLGDTAIEPGSAITFSEPQTLYLVEGNVCAAITPLSAEGLVPDQAPSFLIDFGHASGPDAPMGRIAVDLYEGPQTEFNVPSLMAGFALRLGHVADVLEGEPAAVDLRREHDITTATYALGHTKLVLCRSTEMIVERTINGAEVSCPTFDTAFSHVDGCRVVTTWNGTDYVIDFCASSDAK